MWVKWKEKELFWKVLYKNVRGNGVPKQIRGPCSSQRVSGGKNKTQHKNKTCWGTTFPSFHFILWWTETKDKGLIQFRSEILFLDCIYVEREKAMKWYHPKRKWKWIRFWWQQHKEVFILVCDGLTLWSFAKSIIVKSCSPTLVTMPSHTFLVMIMLVMMVMVIMTIIMMVSNITLLTIFEVYCRIFDKSHLG